MRQDIERIIQSLFEHAYQEENVDADYHASFSDEGSRKAQYIVDDLRQLENSGRISTGDLGYLSIGGSDGSELSYVMDETDIPRAVLIEIGDEAVARATERAKTLANRGKQLIVMQGDATARLDEALGALESFCSSGDISGLVCSAQAVLHELPNRSPDYDLPIFIGKLFRSPGWRTCLFYSREPSLPAGWPDSVRIRIPDLPGPQLVRAASYVRDRLSMTGEPQALASNWVGLPAILAIETLHKLLRGTSIQRIGYELGEQLTSFDPLAVKQHLESLLDGMIVTVEQVTTLGFKKALQEYAVEYRGHDSEYLPVPRTHSEIVGILCRDVADTRPPEAPVSTPVPLQEEPHTDAVFTNPFDGDVPDERIEEWLRQFETGERPLIARLLDGFTYVSFKRLRGLIADLHNQLQDLLDTEASEVLYVPMGGTAKSGGLVSYFYRVENRIPEPRFVDYSSLSAQHGQSSRAVVLLDDLLASGHQAISEWLKLSEANILSDRRVFLATVVSREAGVRYITERTDLCPCSAIQLTGPDEPLSTSSRLFPLEEERSEVRRILKKYGEMLIPSSPFGYAATGLLLAFAHSTPDNTFPIFWSNVGGWLPLLRAGGSPRLGIA